YAGDIGTATSLEAVAPPGRYFVRVKGLNGFGAGPPSNEVLVTLAGSGPCATPPPPPGGFTAEVAGVATRLTWTSAPSASSYVVEAGSAAGLVDLYRSNVGRVLSLATSAPAGRYFVRVRAASACGESAPSAELELTLGCSGLPVGAPTGLTAATRGGGVTLQWAGALGHSGYRLQVGRASGGSELLDLDVGPGTSWQASLAGVAPGTYYVRVRAITGCGVTGPSNEVVVAVP
ncbi:MAG: hypothetical protein OEW19_11575, partial [Acidobacteriota bacterium]|nr:hypothetical protein [Acidobacteriota bacterium]